MDKEGITMRIILASGSPRRKELMRLAELEFEVIPADCEEIIDTESAREAVQSLAHQKALWVAGKEKDSHPADTLVIGADTVVALDDVILGKPADKEDAFRMLKTLSGREHEVYTGVSIISLDRRIDDSFVACTKVKFYPLTDKEIEEYIATGEPFDKAGAYGIQGKGGLLVEGVYGDYNNVVGLPIAELVRRLKKAKP